MTDIETHELAEGLETLFREQFDSRALHAFVDEEGLRQPKLMELARDIGCFSLTLPESLDGLAIEAAAMIPIYATAGGYMPPIPLLMASLGADVLGQALADSWLTRMAEGASVAVCLPPWLSELTMRQSGEQVVLNGTVPFVLDGADADLVLLRANGDNEAAWLICETRSEGVAVSVVQLVDETRHAARITFADVELSAANVIAAGERVAAFDEQLTNHAALAIAADSCGGARAILDKTVEYLKVREQFDRPIGSFQALKHRCADLHLMLVSAKALLDEAAAANRAGDGDAAMLALLACAQCADAYAHIAEDALQLHGGIGFTREHDAHLYLKRAKLNQALLGGTSALRDAAVGFER